MHMLVLVAGDDPRTLMEPFAEYRSSSPYPVALTPEEAAAMAVEFGLVPTDVEAIASRVEDWLGWPGHVVDGRVVYMSTQNPKRKYDGFLLGGRFDGYLTLRSVEGQAATNTARKSDVDHAAILATLPFALVAGGRWHDASDPGAHDWPERFRVVFDRLPGRTLLHVVDAHT